MQLARHAVVLGTGIAGLLAARVLTDSHDRVTMIERDRLADADGSRRGVPQGGHSHVLQPRGAQILDELLLDPDGLLVAGDGLCSFSPVHGQGMTVAALEALELRR